MTRESLTEAFCEDQREVRLESPIVIKGKSIPGRRNSQCKGPEACVREYHLHSETPEEASVARAEATRGRAEDTMKQKPMP